MKKKELEELKRVSAKRNYYTTVDSGRIFLFALIVPFLVGLLFCYVSLAITHTSKIDELFQNNLWFAIPMTLLTQVCFIVIYFVYNKTMRVSFSASRFSIKKAKPTMALMSVFVGIFVVFGFILLIEGVFGNFFHAIGVKSSSLALPNDTVGWLFINILLLGVIPPICEEFLFRGAIFGGLRERFSATSSIFLSALLFALMHQSLTQFIYPFIMGVLLAFVMEKTGNLLYTILIHMFNNILTVVINFLIATGALKWSFIGMAWWVYVLAIVVALVACAVLFVIYKFYLCKQQRIEVEKEGEAIQPLGMNIGKMPLTLFIGMCVALAIIIVNVAS